jgi:hypothetical protein
MMEKMMKANHNETLACRETTEERIKEKKATSLDRKPEAAQKAEAPAENATVMLVEEPKKKRHRGRQLAAERCRQKQKNSTWGNCGPPKELADKKMSHHATVAQCMRDIHALNTTRHAKVARQIKENDRKVPGHPRIAWHKRSVIRRNCTRAMIERATQEEFHEH